MSTDAAASSRPPGSVALVSALIALAIIPVNFGVWVLISRDSTTTSLTLFTLLALGQLACGLVALVAGVRARIVTGRGLGPALAGALAALGAVGGWLAGLTVIFFSAGGAWGRPLRIRGRQRHPELEEGSDWTRGERPDGRPLDEATRLALEALWLHDAQKEHASVPAFSRISWMLAAVGAPHAEFSWALLAWLLERDRARVQPAVERALADLERYRRPTAVSWDKLPLVARADAASLRAHGRLPDERWGELWDQRLRETRFRALSLLGLPAATVRAKEAS